MTNRRNKMRTLTAALIVACLAILTTGSLAYFTAEDRAHNVITTNGVDITLLEKMHDEDGKLVDFPEEGIKHVMPGVAVEKIVSVENSGTGKAWIRVKLTSAVTSEAGETLPDTLADGTPAIVIDYTKDTKWIQGEDGWWYYDAEVNAGETTQTLFETVHFAETLTNDYQGCTANVIVTAQAVQSANNGNSVLEAAGWPE